MYKVVIVDDEPMIVEGLKTAIDWEGYHMEIVCAVTNPIAALEYIKSSGENVCLLITDVTMPELSGIELIKQAKAVNPLLFALVLSAFDNFEFVRSALKYGAENYLLKPLDPDELAESVGQIVRHAQEREQLSMSYSLNMLTFRSNFTENWVKDTLSANEFKTRASVLGVNTDSGNFTVAIFSSRDNNQQRMSQFFELLLSKLLGRFPAHFYFETPFYLVCILSEPEQNGNAVPSFLEEISESASARYNIFNCFGSKVNHFSKVGLSYQEARSLLFLKYTQKTNGSLDSVIQCELKALLLTLGKDTEDAIKMHPELIKQLNRFPDSLADSQAFTDYAEEFAKKCHELLHSSNQKQPLSPFIEAALKSLNEFSDKDISLKTLANKLNVSPSYLGNMFKQQTGYYFNDYLSEARIKYAAKLIETTDMKMKEIVEKVGFSSQTYFNRTFKRYYNASPVAFRRKIMLDNL